MKIFTSRVSFSTSNCWPIWDLFFNLKRSYFSWKQTKIHQTPQWRICFHSGGVGERQTSRMAHQLVPRQSPGARTQGRNATYLQPGHHRRWPLHPAAAGTSRWSWPSWLWITGRTSWCIPAGNTGSPVGSRVPCLRQQAEGGFGEPAGYKTKPHVNYIQGNWHLVLSQETSPKR